MNFRHFILRGRYSNFVTIFQIVVLESYNSFHHKMNKVGRIGMKRAFLLQKETIHVFFYKKRLFQCQCLTNDQGTFFVV